jgi:hypothetical protein
MVFHFMNVNNTERLGEEKDGGRGIVTRTGFGFQNEFSYNVHGSIAHSSPEYILELALPHWAIHHGVGLVLLDGPAFLRSDGVTWCFRISSSNIPPVFRAGMPLCRCSWKVLTQMLIVLPSGQSCQHLGPLNQDLFHSMITRGPPALKHLLRNLKLNSIRM